MAVTRFLLLATAVFALTSGLQHINVRQRLANNLRRARPLSRQNPSHTLGLVNGESLQMVKQMHTVKGTVTTKFQEMYQGIPVLGQMVTIETGPGFSYTGKITGTLVEGLKEDLPSIVPKLSVLDALKIATKKEGDDISQITFRPKHDAQAQVFIDDEDKAHMTYKLSYNLENHLKVSRPFYIIDANSGEVLVSWQGIQSTTTLQQPQRPQTSKASTHKQQPRADWQVAGVGGNAKMGQHEYGVGDRPLLAMTSNDGGANCLTDNDKTLTVHMHNQYAGSNVAHEFTCDEGVIDPSNEAFSPVNDGHFHSNIVEDMFLDWYGIPPLTFKLVTRVHYGVNYENAFWNGEQLTFGDGDTTFYPLVAMDVTAHEVAHGFTEQNSGLLYYNQHGGINEAFSDMAGEGSETYADHYTENDWLVGAEITKTMTALRYMYDPPLDGSSIDHADDYSVGMNVHYSSGVYNKAFYLLSITDGWNTRQSFDVFVLANQMYWGPTSGYDDCACGVISAAEDLGHSTAGIIAAFSQVGVACDQ